MTDAFQGHNEPCYYCGKPCDGLAGNPGLWPVALCHSDDPGLVRYHHDECVTARLEAAQPQMAVVEAARDLVKLVPPVIAEALREMQGGRTMRDLLVAANNLNTAVPALNKALTALPATLEAAQPMLRWLPITDVQRDGEIYLLSRGEPQLSVFVGYWDHRCRGWFSIAGAYVMEPEPIYYISLAALPPEPWAAEANPAT